jgi:hypothetical protein
LLAKLLPIERDYLDLTKGSCVPFTKDVLSVNASEVKEVTKTEKLTRIIMIV